SCRGSTARRQGRSSSTAATSRSSGRTGARGSAWGGRSRCRTSSRCCRCSRTSGSRPRRGSAGRCGSGGGRRGYARRSSGLGGRIDTQAGELAHGDKRKLELAMLLAADPRVILLDEPMAGVSAEDVPELVELIRSVHADEGKTVLMVEHHMDVVTGLVQRI